MYFNIYSIPLFFSCFILCILVYYIKEYRTIQGAKYLSLLLISIIFYSLFYALEISSTDIQTILMFYKMQYIGLSVLPIFFLLFTLSYSGKKNGLPKPIMILLSGIPVITLLLVFTTEHHDLFHRSEYIFDGGLFPTFGFEPGTWYWVHIIFTTVCIILGLMILFSLLQVTLPDFHKQIYIVIIGSSIPFITLFIRLAGISPWGIDPSPFSLTLSAIIIFMGFTRYKLFDLTPVARTLLFENIHEGVIVFDREQRIVDYNNSAVNDGYTKPNDIGTHVSKLPEPWCDILNREADDGENDSTEVKQEIDGSDLWFNITFLPLHDNYGNKMGQMVIISNITERKYAEEELCKAIDKANYLAIEAETANTAKSAFLANMSHELRTPLNSIIGFSDILLEAETGSLNEKQIKYITNVSNSGKHLLLVINDILDISKIEAGKMELSCDSISVHDIANEVLMACSSLAASKRIELNPNIDRSIGTIKADRVKLKQILYNLLSNAIKFTPNAGKVTLNIRSDDKRILFEVIDTGDGISKEDQKKLFKVFGQLDTANNRRYEGTGLGLAIVKKLVEMHKGTVWVESEIGKGSTFAFEIPVRYGPQQSV